MSLHDVDKNQDRRTQPRPNTNDDVTNRMAHNTMGTTYRKDSSANNQRVIFKNSVILTYDNDNRVSSVYGYIPELVDYPVLIIAKPGYDVYEDILEISSPIV